MGKPNEMQEIYDNHALLLQTNARLKAEKADLLRMLKQAVARIHIANAEGDPILSAWLPDAEAAIKDAKMAADLKAQNAELLGALRNWREWHADHFEDFGQEVSAQLLCLDNESAAAIAKAERGQA